MGFGAFATYTSDDFILCWQTVFLRTSDAVKPDFGEITIFCTFGRFR